MAKRSTIIHSSGPASRPILINMDGLKHNSTVGAANVMLNSIPATPPTQRVQGTIVG